MTPPKTTQAGQPGQTPGASTAVFGCALETLRNRSDFLAANRGARQGMPGFLLQALKRAETETGRPIIRVGFTCSKKVGNAVARNYAKRRLREIARAVLPIEGKPGWDYVLIGRPGVTSARPYSVMLADLSKALAKVHKPR